MQARHLFNNFHLSDGLSSLQLFTFSLQRFAFNVTAQKRLSGNHVVFLWSVSLYHHNVLADWRQGAFRPFLLKIPPAVICVCYNLSICSNMREVDGSLMWDSLSHSNEVYCFPLTDTPWPATGRNLISKPRASTREPLSLGFLVQHCNDKYRDWNRPFSCVCLFLCLIYSVHYK